MCPLPYCRENSWYETSAPPVGFRTLRTLNVWRDSASTGELLVLNNGNSGAGLQVQFLVLISAAQTLPLVTKSATEQVIERSLTCSPPERDSPEDFSPEAPPPEARGWRLPSQSRLSSSSRKGLNTE